MDNNGGWGGAVEMEGRWRGLGLSLGWGGKTELYLNNNKIREEKMHCLWGRTVSLIGVICKH